MPFSVPGRKGATLVERDEGPRLDASLESLAGLRPAFEDLGPQRTVTAGNASQISDGAAAVVVADEATAKAASTPWKARIVAAASSGVPPKEIFIAPVAAIERALAKARLKLSEIDLVEMNEAFAAQCLACGQPLELDLERHEHPRRRDRLGTSDRRQRSARAGDAAARLARPSAAARFGRALPRAAETRWP